MIKYPLYLVPFDFSSVAENALKVSIDLAKKNDGSIYLLNVAKYKSELTKARYQFSSIIKSLPKEDQKLVMSNVIVGNVFDDIQKSISILRPSLVVIGTHGAKGMQKLFGSYIEKIVSHSSSPLLIVQGENDVEKMKNIVMSFNFTRESLQIIQFAARMAKKFNACIHLVGQHDDIDFHEGKIETNILFAKRHLQEQNVCFEIVNLPNKKPFGTEMIDYAKSVNADIIASTYPNNDHIIQTTNTKMQSLFENALQIPILTINEEDLSTAHY